MGEIFFLSDQGLELLRETYLRKYGLNISEQFFRCADMQLTQDFDLKTGIKVNRHVGFAGGSHDIGYINGIISQFSLYLYVNHNWNPVTIKWKSLSGRIYGFHDTDIDCDDIRFWFDDLDVALVYKQLYPNTKLPFKLPPLSYELVVTRVNMDCTLELDLKEAAATGADEAAGKINVFMAAFNDQSEKKDRKYGVVHNWKTHTEAGKIIYEIDLGSAGAYFLKKLLLFLSGTGYFSRVEIC